MVRSKKEQEEDLAWFKSTFHPVPKPAFPDDCVEYCLYILDSSFKGDNTEILERLRGVQKTSAELIKDLLKDYIWQRESYRLELAREDGLSVLRGRTNFGDSIEDEWLIVYLLRELSKRFPKDLWIRVVDNDGEFLLIEGVGAMLEGLDGPEVGANKVWINEGKLKILHDGKIAANILTLQEAKKIIVEDPQRLNYFPALEKEAFHRLQKYPEQIINSIHHTLLCLPRKVAFLLHQKPVYVSPAVEAFYLRDPIALRPLQAKDGRNLVLKPEDFVIVSVKFPRVAYAQMKSQDFPTPFTWQHGLSQLKDTDGGPRAEMGMKLTCGLEMLLTDPQNQDKSSVREIKMLLNDIETGDDNLPSDEEIEKWGKQNDDESWMNVKYEDLERELAGKRKKGSNPLDDPESWTDKDAQENLKRIVSRFQQFLNDDDADTDGAAFDFLADSDDDEGEDSEDSGEDKDKSFNEEELSNMMREMMGMPPEDVVPEGSSSTAQRIRSGRVLEELDSSEDDEGENIEDVMKKVEAELNGMGALDLDPKPSRSETAQRSIKGKDSGGGTRKGKGKEKAIEPSSLSKDDEDGEENDDEWGNDSGNEENDEHGEGDIDYALLKNLLESFKSQAGTAGPAGNLMGLMGLNLPRDESGLPKPPKKSNR